MIANSLPPIASRRAVRQASLVYTSDTSPGIQRIRKGKAFVYNSSRGKLIRGAAILTRIRKLVIPPAWTNVWICPTARGHLQATGRDARRRKQYRYHDDWRALRDDTKFHELAGF